MQTHFPGSGITEQDQLMNEADTNLSNLNWRTVNQVVSEDKNKMVELIPHLVRLYGLCLAHRYTLESLDGGQVSINSKDR